MTAMAWYFAAGARLPTGSEFVADGGERSSPL